MDSVPIPLDGHLSNPPILFNFSSLLGFSEDRSVRYNLRNQILLSGDPFSIQRGLGISVRVSSFSRGRERKYFFSRARERAKLDVVADKQASIKWAFRASHDIGKVVQ